MYVPLCMYGVRQCIYLRIYAYIHNPQRTVHTDNTQCPMEYYVDYSVCTTHFTLGNSLSTLIAKIAVCVLCIPNTLTLTIIIILTTLILSNSHTLSLYYCTSLTFIIRSSVLYSPVLKTEYGHYNSFYVTLSTLGL